MDERFKPIFKVDYSLVRDENGNQDLYCKTSDNVSIISEHYLGNIKDIVGYIEENQQLKEQVSYLRRSVERKEEKIDDLEEERIPYTNEYVKKLENQQKEFIELLKTSIANCNKYLNNKDNDWDEDGRGFALTRKAAFVEALSKYKEIVGVKDE